MSPPLLPQDITMTSETEETVLDLLPCPFCGCARIYERGFRCFECPECRAEGPTKATKAEAVAAWNTRAALSRAPGGEELGSSTRMTSPASRSPEPLSAGWQEIESAPRGTTSILIWSEYGVSIAARYWGEEFTHWMPLPPPPTDAERERIEFEFLENPPEADMTIEPFKHCAACNSPRTGDACRKCGGPLRDPHPDWKWPRLPDVEQIRALAKEKGYAVGVHGTLERDLDLIAAPWTEAACSPQELAEHIAKGMNGSVIDVGEKPLGRWACNIQIDGWFKLIDLSVAPRGIGQSDPLYLHPSPEMGEWRPEVRAFADLMEAQLRANDHKPGWKDDTDLDLFERLGQESAELLAALRRNAKRLMWGDSWVMEDTVPRVGAEAADVANFAMMIADVCGALKLKENGLSREELGGLARSQPGAAGPSDCAETDVPLSDGGEG